MQVENLANNLPLPVNLQQREHVSELVPSPVIQLQPHGGDCARHIDAGQPGLETGRGPILIIPVKELLDWPREQVGADIPEDRRVRVKGRLHIVATA